MASGDLLADFGPQSNEPPATVAALPNTRNAIPLLDFDASTAWSAVFGAFLPNNYAAGGINVTIVWMAASATSGNVVWLAAIERDEAGGTDADADSFATAQTATGAANAASGVRTYTTIALSNAQIDGLLKNEKYRLKITRDATNGSDTMTGNASIERIMIREQ
jgi:hypothetical protein